MRIEHYYRQSPAALKRRRVLPRIHRDPCPFHHESNPFIGNARGRDSRPRLATGALSWAASRLVEGVAQERRDVAVAQPGDVVRELTVLRPINKQLRNIRRAGCRLRLPKR